MNAQSAEPLHRKTNKISFELDEDVINGLERLRDTLGFPIEIMISQSLRPFVNTFLPMANLHEQGQLSMANLPDIQNAVEHMVVKTDVEKARFDKSIKKLDKQIKLHNGVKE